MRSGLEQSETAGLLAVAGSKVQAPAAAAYRRILAAADKTSVTTGIVDDTSYIRAA